MDAFMGQIMLFGGSYAPVNWLECDGRDMPIDQNPALFSILGVTYGGDGKTTFKLPKLDAPLEGLRYVICNYGIYPPRN